MKSFTVEIPDDKVFEFEAFLKKLNLTVTNISILEEDDALKVEEWHRETVELDKNNEYIASDDIEKTTFSREA